MRGAALANPTLPLLALCLLLLSTPVFPMYSLDIPTGRYINVDDCWHGERLANGTITHDAAKFPSGIKALADYVHSKGLLFGIYSDAGQKTCAGRPGSWGYETNDANTYAEWGVDLLKYASLRIGAPH